MSQQISRRSFLGGVSTITMTGIAGCLGGDDGLEDGEHISPNPQSILVAPENHPEEHDAGWETVTTEENDSESNDHAIKETAVDAAEVEVGVEQSAYVFNEDEFDSAEEDHDAWRMFHEEEDGEMNNLDIGDDGFLVEYSDDGLAEVSFFENNVNVLVVVRGDTSVGDVATSIAEQAHSNLLEAVSMD